MAVTDIFVSRILYFSRKHVQLFKEANYRLSSKSQMIYYIYCHIYYSGYKTIARKFTTYVKEKKVSLLQETLISALF